MNNVKSKLMCGSCLPELGKAIPIQKRRRAWSNYLSTSSTNSLVAERKASRRPLACQWASSVKWRDRPANWVSFEDSSAHCNGYVSYGWIDASLWNLGWRLERSHSSEIIDPIGNQSIMIDNDQFAFPKQTHIIRLLTWRAELADCKFAKVALHILMNQTNELVFILIDFGFRL